MTIPKKTLQKENDKYDFIFDAVGKSTFGKCLAIIKRKRSLYIFRVRTLFPKYFLFLY